ncbi:MAG: polymerase sigma factor, sigma-70 family [Thermoleophilia bacterium]|nr:polymerase sigma factor, sigma-70 family [Thermoleophilia bacterium]
MNFRTIAIATVTLACTLIAAPGASAATTSTQYDHLLAPTTSCAGQHGGAASVATQTAAMHCLIAYTRAKSGLRATAAMTALDTSAARKAADIVRCQQFSHTACGRAWDYWIKSSGTRFTRWAENIAWGSDSGGRSTPRATMRAWLYSTGHRTNILNASFNVAGVGLVRGKFQGYAAGVWVQHFGTR